MNRLQILLLFALIMTLTGCSTGACYDNQNSLPKAGFYSAETGEAVSISGVAIGGVGAPNDSLLCEASETASEVYLPFRPNEETTSFAFRSGGIADIVTFSYETRPYFASADCGAVWVFRIKEVSWRGALIDSVAVIDSLITNVDAQQLKIFVNAPEPEEDPEEKE